MYKILGQPAVSVEKDSTKYNPFVILYNTVLPWRRAELHDMDKICNVKNFLIIWLKNLRNKYSADAVYTQ